MANITEKAIVTITSSPLLFTELVFIYVSISEQQTWAFDRNKRDTEIFH